MKRKFQIYSTFPLTTRLAWVVAGNFAEIEDPGGWYFIGGTGKRYSIQGKEFIRKEGGAELQALVFVIGDINVIQRLQAEFADKDVIELSMEGFAK